ncbi:peptidylprolyl isomerase [Paraconexibacter sp.]|uniref:peptidylprolyl isomerase n=1 Tax=Paraconexibacter sp. TaxID=2949640 RepID=UPI0035669F38
MRRFLTVLLTIPILALAACGDDSTIEGTPSSTAATDGTTTAPAGTTPEEGGAETVTAEGCKAVEAPDPKGEQRLEAPSEGLDPAKTYTVTFATNCGSFSVRLDVKNSPKTSASMAALVKSGFYDGLTFHRIVPGFVIQGGDPLGDGQGGPGYSVVESPKSSATYTKGVVAMAKTQIEDPGTSGSQFFVVSGDDAGLPPEYAVAGKVTKGLDTVETIEQVPVGPNDVPQTPVVISKATLKVS